MKRYNNSIWGDKNMKCLSVKKMLFFGIYLNIVIVPTVVCSVHFSRARHRIFLKTLRSLKEVTRETLLDILKEEKRGQVYGGIYHKLRLNLPTNQTILMADAFPTSEPVVFLKTTSLVSPMKGCVWMILLNPLFIFDALMKSLKAQLREKFSEWLYFILKTGTCDAQKEITRLEEVWLKWKNQLSIIIPKKM